LGCTLKVGQGGKKRKVFQEETREPNRCFSNRQSGEKNSGQTEKKTRLMEKIDGGFQGKEKAEEEDKDRAEKKSTDLEHGAQTQMLENHSKKQKKYGKQRKRLSTKKREYKSPFVSAVKKEGAKRENAQGGQKKACRERNKTCR